MMEKSHVSSKILISLEHAVTLSYFSSFSPVQREHIVPPLHQMPKTLLLKIEVLPSVGI